MFGHLQYRGNTVAVTLEATIVFLSFVRDKFKSACLDDCMRAVFGQTVFFTYPFMLINTYLNLTLISTHMLYLIE